MPKLASSLPPLVATIVSSHDGFSRRKVVVNLVGLDPGHERVFDSLLVHNTNYTTSFRGLKDGVKGTLLAIRRIHLDDLLVVVGSLE